MIALQGPTSDDVLDGAVADIPSFAFADRTIAGVGCLVARTGYTGERGVEIVTPAADTAAVWDHLLAAGAVPCGLGARDTLRLEVCYPLHGNDITPEHQRDRGRPRLGVRAAEGLHRRRRAAPDEGGGAGPSGSSRSAWPSARSRAAAWQIPMRPATPLGAVT